MSDGAGEPGAIGAERRGGDESPAGAGEPRCGRCDAKLAAGALQGTCPRCLLGCALDETVVGGPRPPRTLDAEPDRRLPERFGRYVVRRLIGRGAMGDVYLADDEELKRTVAIKTPQIGRVNDPTMLERFRREARLAAALHHPHICPVYDVGEVDGTLYFTMAYVDGWPLPRWLADPKPISLRQAANLVRKLALAMSYAHRQHIVHRDLKPANVMIDRRGEPIIMDFGLARHDSVDVRLTQSNMVVGTPAYLAPELIAGKDDSPATDIYALGVVLFELLTKRLPFAGHLGEMLAQITRDPAPAPSTFRADVTPTLDEVCRRALAKSPADRFGSMDEMAEALAAAFRPTAETVEPAASTEATPLDSAPPVRIVSTPAPGKSRGVRRRVLLAGAACAALATLGGWWWFAGGESRGERRETAGLRSEAPDDVAPAVDGRSRLESDASPVAPSADGASSDESGAGSTGAVAPSTGRGERPAEPGAPLAETPPAIVEAAPLPVFPRFEPLRPDDPPRATVTLADRMLDELRRIGDERRRLRLAVAATTARLSDELPKVRTVAAGELASARRFAEAADAERQDYERRAAFLDTQRPNASGADRLQIDRQIDGLAKARAGVLARRQQFELEIRGKLVEIARIDEESRELSRTLERLVIDAQHLVDLAFWTSDPCETYGPGLQESFVRIYAEWLVDSPEQVEILALRGLAAARAGRADSALRDAQRAYALQSKSSLALAVQGYAKVRKGQTNEGLSELNRAMRLAPQSPYAPFLRGMADLERKNPVAALDAFAKASSLAPLAPWTKAQWARAALLVSSEKAPDVAKTIAAAEGAAESSRRESWYCLDVLALALAADWRFADAAAAEQAALDLAPPSERPGCAERLAAYQAGRKAP